MNFAALFNQFRGGNSNTVNVLLEDGNVQLQKLLDEDSLINEYKSSNTKLMEYLKYDKYRELVEYVTLIGPQQDKKRGYKYPLNAMEILSADNPATIDFFFPTGPLYDEEITYQDQEIEIEVEDQGKALEQQGIQTLPKTIIQDVFDNENKEIGAKKEEDKKQEKEQDKQQNKQEELQENHQKGKICEKKTKIIKSVQKVQKINKIEAEPLIDKLFSYFDSEVNYTLAGYVCKILCAFFMKKHIQLMKYLFKNKNQNALKLLKHIESRSVGEFIVKFLSQQSTEFILQRDEFFGSLLNTLSVDSEIHVMSNISACVCDLIDKISTHMKSADPINEFSAIFLAPQTIMTVIKNIMRDQENVSVYNTPILYTYLTSVPFTLPNNQKLISDFKMILKQFIEKGINKINTDKTQRVVLGLGRVKIIEIFNFIIKNNILDASNTIARHHNFFPTLFNLCCNYSMNNMLHNQVTKILELIFQDDNHSSLQQKLMENNLLLKFLKEETEQDIKIRAGTHERKVRKGYIGHIVKIFKLLTKFCQKNDNNSKLLESSDFKFTEQNLINRQIVAVEKNLAGYAVRRDLVHGIMFHKEQIIQQYISFLNHAAAPVFEPEQEPINIQHPDLIAQMQRQLVTTIEQSPKKINQNQKIQQQFQPLQKQASQYFQKKYLHYDIEQLIKDL